MLGSRKVKIIGPNPDRQRRSSAAANSKLDSDHELLIKTLQKSVLAGPNDVDSGVNWDELEANDTYQDTRIELRTVGHNLTSVLINPRESIFDSFVDEFEIDQSMPLDHSATSSPMPLLGNAGGSISHIASPMALLTSLQLFPATTATDMESLQKLINRMKRILSEFELLHHKHTKDNHDLGYLLTASSSSSNDSILSCFKTVPEIFFRPDFSLQNPEIFNIVFGHIHSSADAPGDHIQTQHRANSTINQQETLSTHLDMIETALLKQIWVRSPAFFRALDDLTGIQVLVTNTYKRLGALREQMAIIDNEVAVSALRIPQMYLRQNNEMKLYDKLIMIKQIIEKKGYIQSLIDAEDYLGAVEVIINAKEMYASLSELTCLKKLGQQLDEYDRLINEILCNRFISEAIDFDCDKVTSVNPAPKATSSFGQILMTLLHMNKLQAALMMYKSRLSDSLRLIIRTCVIEYLAAFDPTLASEYEIMVQPSEPDTPFTQRVKDMPIDSFLSCLTLCFEQLLSALHKSEAVHTYTEQFIHSVDANEQEVTLSKEAVENLVILSRSCVNSCCDLSQRSIQQLLTIRRDSTTRLPLEKMKSLWESCLSFISSLEKVSGASAYDIKRSLVSHTKDFLVNLHENMKRSIHTTLDAERWIQCDVSDERQVDIDKLASGKAFLQPVTRPVGSSSKSVKSDEAMVVLGVPVSSSASAVNGTPVSTVAPKKKDTRPAKVDGNVYKICWSALYVHEISLKYLDIAMSFSSLTTDVITKTADLLKFFDKRTKDLVLCAEAIESAAKLKSISAKHLAITAQSISFLLALLPHLRAALLAQLPSNQHMQLVELDRVSQSFIEHHGLIVDKLVEIAAYAVDGSSLGLRKIDWDRYTGCDYFVEVLKNISALHRVLQESLPVEQIQDIFSRIFAAISRKIPQHFDEILPTTKAGKQRILDEISHLVGELSRLKGESAALNTLEESFRKKYSTVD